MIHILSTNPEFRFDFFKGASDYVCTVAGAVSTVHICRKLDSLDLASLLSY
jgi:hypothetical protein